MWKIIVYFLLLKNIYFLQSLIQKWNIIEYFVSLKKNIIFSSYNIKVIYYWVCYATKQYIYTFFSKVIISQWYILEYFVKLEKEFLFKL